MQLNGKLCILLHGLDQLACLVGNQKPCHILDTDRVRSHFLDLLRRICPVFQSVRITQRIGQSHLCMASALLLLHPVCGVYRLLQVGKIVQAVEDTDNIDTVCNGLLHKSIHHVIGIGSVAQNILPAEQHLQLGVLEAVAKLAESVPGVLLQETKGCVKGCAAPALYGVIADLIHFAHNGKHEIGGHSGGNQ